MHLEMWDVRMYTGFMWFKIQTTGGIMWAGLWTIGELLWRCVWTFLFHKMKNTLISFAAFVVLPVALQKTRVSQNVTSCLVARSSGRFEGLSFLILRLKKSRIKMIAVRTFETSVSGRPKTRNMHEDLRLQGHYCVVRIETVQFSSAQFVLYITASPLLGPQLSRHIQT
jgi:hypothetical protein